MVPKEPIELIEGLPEEGQSILLAFTVLIERISSLPKSDRDDLFELVTALRNASDKEDQRAVRRAMIEILTQKKVSAQKLPLTGAETPPRSSQAWSKHVGQAIRSLRARAGLTQADLSEKAGLPQSHISRLENAEHSATYLTLEKIAKALGVTVRDIDPCID